MMLRTLRLVSLLSAPWLAMACTGAINGEGGAAPGSPEPGAMPSGPGGTGGPAGPGAGGPSGPAGPSGPGGPSGLQPLSDEKSVPGPAPIRRLTKVEYDNTLRDLLGVQMAVSQSPGFLADTESQTAGFVRGGNITGGDDARNLMAASSTAVDSIKGKLPGLLPCSPISTGAAEQAACAKSFITQFGKRAFRRPLTAREVELAEKLFATQRGPEVGASFEDAIGDLVAAFIQAPQFLYHWELGTAAPQREGALVKYNSYEIASRLSYLFWATMPDQGLFAAADANALQTPEQIAREARRLLADDRAKQGLTDFHLQFLEVGALTQLPKDDSVKDFSPAVAQSMLNETRDFVASVFKGAKATASLETLLTAPFTVADPSVAKIYGVTDMRGTGPQEIALDPKQRAGLFTQLAFLTSHADTGDSHPVKRGDAVLRRLLCVELVVPPSLMIPPVAEATPGGATTRQRFEEHMAEPCVGCHKMIDPVGFAFEGYDTVGAYRTTDQNKTINTAGEVTLPTTGTKIAFQNAIELTAKLAKLPEVQDCVATQWMRYMLGRREVDSEKASITVALDLFRKTNFDFRELLVGMTRTRSFTHRSPSAGEVIQ